MRRKALLIGNTNDLAGVQVDIIKTKGHLEQSAFSYGLGAGGVGFG
jgi:hypothetical protein